MIEYKNHKLKDKGSNDYFLECHGESINIRISSEESIDPLLFCPKCGQKLEKKIIRETSVYLEMEQENE
jgi:rRNA maturation endonuclease Nob1